MKKELFDRFIGKKVTIGLKPNYFRLTGVIDQTFEDCFQFTTDQKTSYIDYEHVVALVDHTHEKPERM